MITNTSRSLRSPTGMAIAATAGVGAFYYASVRTDLKSKNDHENQQAKLDEKFHPNKEGDKTKPTTNIRSVN